MSADEAVLSGNEWTYDGRRFEVNSFRHGDASARCYELYAVTPGTAGNGPVEVRIPPAGPPEDRGMFVAHGEWGIPWPVFRRFGGVVEVR